MIASLPMYDTARTGAANDRLWQLIRQAYGRGPEALDRGPDPEAQWRDPALVFSLEKNKLITSAVIISHS